MFILATISSRISSLEAGHRVALHTPCEEVSDLISMAPGSQKATFLSEDEPGEGESDTSSLKELTNSEFCETEEELD
jgi:hypothetical protein